ncbi:hypothetical protein GMD78_04950 [Ornithinibacillus sp. L9]|uniref:Uncharacterized protein n=1 Tax=Ornithinibacillus caprae TaxID=2678566 RepID=A0A6N8FJ04_9BACI|nr:hypothetical protein [Ornithinibacillus caprae]MUK87749.1 hypothetical protein [Ornithinibacillus caprae]
MVNQDFDKFIKNQKREKAIYPGHGERAQNTDPKTNNRKVSNQHPGAEGRDI